MSAKKFRQPLYDHDEAVKKEEELMPSEGSGGMTVASAISVLQALEKKGMGDRRLVSTGGHQHGDDVVFEVSEDYGEHPCFKDNVREGVVYVDFVEENRDGF